MRPLILALAAAGAALAAGPGYNGLALTPPMGWNTWNRFGCDINDSLIRQTADALVASGMAAAGYKYINIDDCWQELGRDAQGHVRPLARSFPKGIKPVADYVHSKGLKLGVYSDRGFTTCGHHEGSYMHETIDANDYAAWGVDYLKYDNCDPAPGSNQQQDYARMRDALVHSGRDIVFSICAWGFADWEPVTGNLWRTTGDIQANWESILANYDNNVGLAKWAKPGAWNDPDMLEVGNGKLTTVEARSHMSLWAIMAAPLIAGNDLRNMPDSIKEVLTAPEVLAVDQDSLGQQGVKVRDDGTAEVLSKPLAGGAARAVALFNRGTAPATIKVSWAEIGLPAGNAIVRDLWKRKDAGLFAGSYSATVPARGTVLVRITAGNGVSLAGAAGEGAGRLRRLGPREFALGGLPEAASTWQIALTDARGRSVPFQRRDGSGEARIRIAGAATGAFCLRARAGGESRTMRLAVLP